MKCCRPERLHGGGRARFSSRPRWRHCFMRGESGVDKQLWKHADKYMKHLRVCERCVETAPSRMAAEPSRGEGDCGSDSAFLKGTSAVVPFSARLRGSRGRSLLARAVVVTLSARCIVYCPWLSDLKWYILWLVFVCAGGSISCECSDLMLAESWL